jgi:fructose-bisphosphate aldolase class I
MTERDMAKEEQEKRVANRPQAVMSLLVATARTLMAKGKGLLAMDESVGSCNRRLAEVGAAQTMESRRRYRDLLVTTPGLSEAISGAILFDETLQQRTNAGTLMADVLRQACGLPNGARY